MTLETFTMSRLLTDVSAEDLPISPYYRESSTSFPREKQAPVIKKEQFSHLEKAEHLLADTALCVLGLV